MYTCSPIVLRSSRQQNNLHRTDIFTAQDHKSTLTLIAPAAPSISLTSLVRRCGKIGCRAFGIRPSVVRKRTYMNDALSPPSRSHHTPTVCHSVVIERCGLHSQGDHPSTSVLGTMKDMANPFLYRQPPTFQRASARPGRSSAALSCSSSKRGRTNKDGFGILKHRYKTIYRIE